MKIERTDFNGNKTIQIDNGEITKVEKKKKYDKPQKENNEVFLVPFESLPFDEQNKKREIIEKPCKTKAEQKRSIKEITNIILSQPISNSTMKELIGEFGIELLQETDATVFGAITVSMVREALKGNVRAYETLRDTSGFVKGADGEALDIMTEADRQLIENIKSRLKNEM